MASSTDDSLVILRSAIAAKINGQLIVEGEGTDDIVKATGLQFDAIPGISSEKIVVELDKPTRFQINDANEETGKRFIDAKTVYNCWLTKDLSVTDYITISDERGITNLKFLERTDLITWLEGASTDSSNIVKDISRGGDKKAAGASGGAGAGKATPDVPGPSKKIVKREIDKDLQKIYNEERALLDHNKILRGNKRIDFASVALDCREKIIKPHKSGAALGASSNSNRNGSSNTSSTTAAANSSLARIPLPTNGKDPIILVSPSASSLLNMSNVREFLESGKFNPVTASSGVADLIRISRRSPKLGTVRFVVVNSVDKFKPEYWDRVVAVFVTGQAWQFKTYKWSDPNTLFQRLLGFALVYKGDPVPATLSQWNVRVESLERTQRFRDRESSERIWDRIEQTMISRGWPVKR